MFTGIIENLGRIEAITPDGGLLLCANMPGNNVVVFQIDTTSGSITPKGEPVEIPMASCIRWME